MPDPIIGKRVILFELDPADLDNFVKLHREDKNGMMGKFCLKEMTEQEAKNYILTLLATGQIKVWTCYTKEGKASKRIGYMYLSDINSFSCAIVGIIDKEVLKGLGKIIRQGKYTFSEDALRTMVSWCFNGANFRRIRYGTFKNNLLSMRLAEKVGFVREGLMRQAFRVGEEYFDIVVYGLLKDEYTLPDKDKMKVEQKE